MHDAVSPRRPRVEWPAEVAAIADVLRAAGVEVWAVGGAVRDALLGVSSKDWDLATPALPHSVAGVVPHPTVVDPRLGAIEVHLPDGYSVTVTTLRRDSDYHDHRHPAHVEFVTDLAVDAARRDFTINALYVDRAGNVLDPLGGWPDLGARVLRVIGDPMTRLREDVLRLLRGVRFAARYDLQIDPPTAGAMRACAPLLAGLSAARSYDELTRAFTAPGRGRALRRLVDLGLAAHVLPEVVAMDGVPQPKDYHPEGDVLTHVCLVLDSVAEGDPVQAWSAVLHDVGKPATLTFAQDRIRFSGHDVLSAQLAQTVLLRLHAPRELRDVVVEICRDHIKFAGIMQMRPRRRERWMRSPHFAAHLAFHRADCLGSHGKLDVWNAAHAAWQALPPQAPPPLCTGADVLALGIEPGPAVGTLLRAVDAEVEELDSADRAVALAILRRLVEKRSGR
jgi:poly(A) polymerase